MGIISVACLKCGNFGRSLPHCHLNGSPSVWRLLVGTIVPPQVPSHMAQWNLSGWGWGGYEFVTGSVLLCLWVGLALLLSIFPLRAEEKMARSLIKGAAAGVWSPWWGVGLLLILLCLEGRQKGMTWIEVAVKGECICLSHGSPSPLVTLVF